MFEIINMSISNNELTVTKTQISLILSWNKWGYELVRNILR